MTFQDIQIIFNRAVKHTFSLKKLLATFLILAFCGCLVVFFRGLAISATGWIVMSLTFMPIFLSASLIFSCGIFLIRVYHNEIKEIKATFSEVLSHSWDVLIGSSIFSVPIILSYLLLWMVLGIFLMLSEIPQIGDFFGVLLAFAPFLLVFGSLLLCVINLCLLFFVTPIVALRGLDRIKIYQTVYQRIQNDLFSNILLSLIASLPLLFVVGLLTLAALLTGGLMSISDHSVYVILQWFFIMIPYTAILAPAIVFFFNFAAETHVLFQKRVEEESKV